MEEVDQIIIHTLRQVGCELGDDVVSLKQFTTEITVEGVVRCLRFISPDRELPIHVSPNMVERYNLGMTLASACTELGFKGDLGYQTFLYSSEAEMRRIFMFLIEKLPKESEKIVDQQLGAGAVMARAISEEISRQLNAPWLPSYCKRNGVRWKGSHWWREVSARLTAGRVRGSVQKTEYFLSLGMMNQMMKDVQLKVFYQEQLSRHAQGISCQKMCRKCLGVCSFLPVSHFLFGIEHRQRKKERVQKRIADAFQQSLLSTDQSRVDVSKLLSSLSLEDEAARPRGSKFTRAEKLQFTKVSEEETKQAAGDGARLELPKRTSEEDAEAKVKEMQAQLDSISEVIVQLEGQEKELTASMQQVSEDIRVKQAQKAELESQNELEHRALALLPDAEGNIAKLQGKVDAAAQKLVGLSVQWEKHRAPLIEQYRQLKEQCSKRLNETQQKLEEIKSLKDKMREISEQARSKEELHKQLVSEYEKLAKDVNRSSYTKRITEIVGNIKKQKEEIAKVLIDTKTLQKEINQLTGKLDRTFTVTDELIFKDAKKDEAVRRAYKYLASVHENSNQLLQAVEETGSIMREMRDLEDQIEQESQKKVVANLERITADYKQMKQENASLLAQLKGE
ncbi:coiled-coil domain-containing protein, putative [Ixodes scapularis]|uniref:Coiled-coil domain-containing protein 22 homolog n=1 Tax=Ixodes scapularis TaxID=6945 RepID=B7PSQ4_IXOSC|nr:coiled-coil domain-containing protein, putative [Ixodes scapularis]|eukprot:XP_002402814.1 coiled-coil domain-containing protein, putative [Ixodes scapularis]